MKGTQEALERSESENQELREEVQIANCDSCIEYIKQMKRLEFECKIERNQKLAFEGEVDRLNNKISEMEEEERDRVNESFS